LAGNDGLHELQMFNSCVAWLLGWLSDTHELPSRLSRLPVVGSNTDRLFHPRCQVVFDVVIDLLARAVRRVERLDNSR
jgi:hypothetical protein